MTTIIVSVKGVTVRRLAAAAAVAVALLLVAGPASAAPTPTTADGFTAMFAAKNDQTWSGGDQVTSFKHNGHVYWLFGDSVLSNGEDPDGSYPAGAVMVSNRILLQQGDQLVNALSGNAVPDAPTSTGAAQNKHWTQAMFYANSHLYVLAQRVVSDPGDSLGFKLRGVELVKYRQNSDGTLTLVGVFATPSTGVDGGAGPLHIQWSGDALYANGYVYVYGSTGAEGNPFVIHYSYVARVPAAQVENPYAWRYYAKSTNTWRASLGELSQDVTNQPDAILAGQVSSVRWIGNRHVMLHKPWNGWGDTIKATTSPAPWGPWSPEVTVLSSPAGTTPGGQEYWTYSPQLHPEQATTSGKVLVSVAWSGKTLADTWADADLYKPRFYELTLP